MKPEVEMKVDDLIYKEIFCEHKENANWYYVSHNLAAVLEMFADADIEYSQLPPLWKRKAMGELYDDPELITVATAILEHRNELKAMEENDNGRKD